MPTRARGTGDRRGGAIAAVVGLVLLLSAVLLYSGRPGATSDPAAREPGIGESGEPGLGGSRSSPRTQSSPDPRESADPSRRPQSEAPSGVPARDPVSGLRLVSLADLPPEAATTVRLIERGGPFPYERDGLRFGNRERLLPDRPPGWYREYTVPTPGEDDRGARRIVTGDRDREFYYTADHYASFVRIRR